MTFELGNWQFECCACGWLARNDRPVWRCEECAGELRVIGLDSPAIADGGRGLWKWSNTLPVRLTDRSTLLGEGDSPLVPIEIDGVAVHLKLDSLLPSGSFKDRGAAVLATWLRAISAERIIVDSSGNAAAAMAAFAARVGLDCTVYVPASAPSGKLVQARAYGARVVPVEGTREDVARAAEAEAELDRGASYASHNWHPVFVEGVKTWALEVSEQLDGREPDLVFVPTGGGSALVGAWYGFQASGGAMPALIACQPAACSPVVRAWEQSAGIEPFQPQDTLADGTKIALPSRPRQILDAISQTGGGAIAVDEDVLLESMKLLWQMGIYVEPTAALGVAACRLAIASGGVDSGQVVVVHITGHGLKATSLIQDLLDA